MLALSQFSMNEVVDELDGGGDFGDFMRDIEQSMLHMMKESAKAPATALEHWQAFSAAVDWSETWIRALLAFHVILLSIVLLTRKSTDAQTVLFLFVCALIFISEYLNSYCSSNWQQFSKQDYFDKNGVFAATVYAGPLLFIALLQLINFLGLSSSALIKAKRLELKHKQRQQDKDGQDLTINVDEKTSPPTSGK